MSRVHSSPSDVTAETALAEAEARTKLSRMLATSLDVGDVITLFFTGIQSLVRVEGLRYVSPDDKDEYVEGKVCTHHCNYRLTTDDCYLGEIIFVRGMRFSDDDMMRLEGLLAFLIYPLRNALRYKQALALALQDSLTGIGNRAALDNALRRELQMAERYQSPLSLLVVDIDHFKRINDEHGHSGGDLVLKEVSTIIQQICRTSDMVFRYGGEEFVVLLSKTDQSGARVIAERLRSTINQQAFSLGVNNTRLTVSIGIGTRLPNEPEHADNLFERTDRALYRAKAKGRNCVVSAFESTERAVS